MTTASQARRMAERIGRLPYEVLESFQFNDPARRVAILEHVEAEILVGMGQVIGWLERRRAADKAELVKRRLLSVLREAVQCAGLEIPEYAGGTVAQATGEPSLGATRTATLVVPAKMFAQELLGWADDIEAEDGHQRPSSATDKTAPAGRGIRHKEPSAGGAKGDERGTVHERMLSEFHRNPECIAWSQREWATRLGCAPSAVAKASAWQTIKKARALAQVDRLERRQRRTTD